jgi:hypothetical protein
MSFDRKATRFSGQLAGHTVCEGTCAGIVLPFRPALVCSAKVRVKRLEIIGTLDAEAVRLLAPRD